MKKSIFEKIVDQSKKVFRELDINFVEKIEENSTVSTVTIILDGLKSERTCLIQLRKEIEKTFKILKTDDLKVTMNLKETALYKNKYIIFYYINQ